MAKNLKKLLSFVLAMIMVLSMIPAVYADETTEPETNETIPEDVQWIEIASEDDWKEWFGGKDKSKLMTTYANSTAYVKLTQDVAFSTNALITIGYTNPVKMDLVLDLGGNTLTINQGTYKNRIFGVYGESDFTIQNGTIVNNVAVTSQHGGLVLVSVGNLNVKNVTVTDNNTGAFACNGKIFSYSANCGGMLENVTITSDTSNSKSSYKTDGSYQYGAGGLISNAGDLTIKNCNFTASSETTVETEKNRIYYGGIVAALGGTTTITDTTFNGGVAYVGGAIGASSTAATVNVENCTFNGSFATNGGVLGAEYGVINATNCTFTGSTATHGGVATVLENGAVNLTDCEITNTVATSRGGALYVYANKRDVAMNVVNTSITNCQAPNGGALMVWGRGTVAITGGTITGCKATTGVGGALYFGNNGWTSGGPKATIDGLTVIDCESVGNGGAMYATNTTVTNKDTGVVTVYTPCEITIKNSHISGGKATQDEAFGGNIYVAGSDRVLSNGTVLRSTVTFENTVIENGEANSWGGNVGIAGFANLIFTDCTIRGGSVVDSKSSGGGNLYMGNANSDITLNNTTVANGTAANFGGNIRIGGGTVIMNGGLIEGGTAAKGSEEIYLNDNAAAVFKMFDGTIRSDATKIPALHSAGKGQLALYNGTVEGFDPTAFVPYGEAVATANGENAYTVKHLAVDGATTKEGTCEEAGTVTIVCPTCEHTYVYEEAAAGHAIVIDKAVAATCTEAGLTEGQHCALCDYAVAQEVIPAA
ncbi:MAG: hypothetical protein IKU07_01415, partial [Oscillospiraceae bacterium]|nr:hypothetical protein [Oscillospiraceae bacterium]